MLKEAKDRLFKGPKVWKLSTKADMRKALGKIPMKDIKDRTIAAEMVLRKEIDERIPHRNGKWYFTDSPPGQAKAVMDAQDCLERLRILSRNQGDPLARKLLEALRKDNPTEEALMDVAKEPIQREKEKWKSVDLSFWKMSFRVLLKCQKMDYARQWFEVIWETRVEK
jgi:hypothetical protein